MKENTDYLLIPDSDDEFHWNIRILTGNFIETVFQIKNISVNEENGYINFSFILKSSPDTELTVEDGVLQEVVGKILSDLIDRSVEDDTVEINERTYRDV